MEIIKVSPINYFNPIQSESILKGKRKRERMKLMISNIINSGIEDVYNNLYIYSPPGLGKTYTVTNYLEQSGKKFFKVTGNTSMFAFGIQLAVINYLNPNMDPVIVYVDDCDEIFKNDQNCNTMKKLLDSDKSFVYEKSLSSQLPFLSDIQRSAIEFYGETGKMGFVVPTHNMSFIFTSNFQLPNDDEVAEARKKGKSKVVLLSHRNAIRSRCKVADFNLTMDEHWGWMADVVLSSDFKCNSMITDEEKLVILDFIWRNWSNLNERSIRLLEKMSLTMKLFPNTYYSIWQIDHLKN